MKGTEEILLSRREAARVAGVHYNTVRLWEQSGRLTPHRQENGDVLISRSELDEVIEARKEETGDGDNPRVAALETEVRLLTTERDRLVADLRSAQERYDKLVERVATIASGA